MIHTGPLKKRTKESDKDHSLSFGGCEPRTHAKLLVLVALGCAFVYGLMGRDVAEVIPGGISVSTLSAEKEKSSAIVNTFSLSNVTDRPIRIFCYGDSLTAGISPPSRDLYPYSTFLRSSLEKNDKNQALKFEVDHAGFPGWMTHELLALVCREDEECTHSLQKVDPSQFRSSTASDTVRNKLLQRDLNNSNPDAAFHDVLIYLAGTNDLGRSERSEKDIAVSILDLHKWAHSVAKISITIALAIPPSAYQRRVPQASEKATRINRQLQSQISQLMTSSASSQAIFLRFPFQYNHDGADNDLWSLDGLHFSQLGYERLGGYLASQIQDLLLR
jgi:lysophospholipase L1-like esterase